ncbi:MAG: hypothetical protein K9L17_14105 [Clostridiales bacterium]|nr:hypothetical protein [Clostridiales bacterium]MCF8023803.1 hypothetical protein [Clostridiales bacterium]
MTDLNKLPKKEINKLARMLAKANEAVHDAIGLTGELTNEIPNIDENEHEEFFKKLADAFDKLNKKDESFANATLHERTFEEFDYLTSIIQKYRQD